MAMRFSFLSIGSQFFNVFFTNINYAIFYTFIIWCTHKKNHFGFVKNQKKKNKYFQTKSTQKFSKLYNTEHSNAREQNAR